MLWTVDKSLHRLTAEKVLASTSSSLAFHGRSKPLGYEVPSLVLHLWHGTSRQRLYVNKALDVVHLGYAQIFNRHALSQSLGMDIRLLALVSIDILHVKHSDLLIYFSVMVRLPVELD